jgi:hypothetical protein
MPLYRADSTLRRATVLASAIAAIACGSRTANPAAAPGGSRTASPLAAPGGAASLGKLNLTLADAAAAETHTVFKRRSTGQSLDLRFTAAFAARYLDVPRDRLAEAGREVMGLPDADIFEVVPNVRP